MRDVLNQENSPKSSPLHAQLLSVSPVPQFLERSAWACSGLVLTAFLLLARHFASSLALFITGPVRLMVPSGWIRKSKPRRPSLRSEEPGRHFRATQKGLSSAERSPWSKGAWGKWWQFSVDSGWGESAVSFSTLKSQVVSMNLCP